MRISLNEIKEIERFLEGKLTIGESLLFKARLLIDPVLRANFHSQRRALSIVHLYHRKKLKEELEQVHQSIFNDPKKEDFQKYIHQLFKK